MGRSVPAPRELKHINIDLKQDPDALHRSILAFCNEAFGWEVAFEDAEFSKISGGISNILVKVTPKGAADTLPPPPGCLAALLRRRAPGAPVPRVPVCVKVFGEKTELLVDRAAERRAVVALGGAGFGPRVLAVFANGRAEEFLHCATLTPTQMCDPAFIPRVAAMLARFHRVRVPAPAAAGGGAGRAAGEFATIRRWLAMARALEFPDSQPAKRAAFEALDFAALEAEADELEAACAAAAPPTVFCHNDLLSGNILVMQRPGFDPDQPDLSGPLTVIDFEYGAYGRRGFDFGNHFNEYAGFECDYTRYPSRASQELFFSHYFGRRGKPKRLAPAELDRLCAEADVFALASHLFWGVWAVVQARYSPIDFDYMAYHHLRIGELRRRKAEFLARAAAAFGPPGGGGGGGGGGARGRRQKRTAAAAE